MSIHTTPIRYTRPHPIHTTPCCEIHQPEGPDKPRTRFRDPLLGLLGLLGLWFTSRCGVFRHGHNIAWHAHHLCPTTSFIEALYTHDPPFLPARPRIPTMQMSFTPSAHRCVTPSRTWASTVDIYSGRRRAIQALHCGALRLRPVHVAALEPFRAPFCAGSWHGSCWISGCRFTGDAMGVVSVSPY
jgi:hypothetical protein